MAVIKVDMKLLNMPEFRPLLYRSFDYVEELRPEIQKFYTVAVFKVRNDELLHVHEDEQISFEVNAALPGIQPFITEFQY